MIQLLTAYTEEVDDVDDGITGILRQINLGALKKNSVGLVTCHSDFINSSFIGELCKKLPFDIIGMTTIASANQHGQGMFSLSLTVLTSDDVVFETAMANSLEPGNYYEKVKAVYSEAVKKFSADPSMILTFFPFIYDISGTQMHKDLDEICGGIPFWGSIASGPDVQTGHWFVFRNGDIDSKGLAMILLHGQVNPEFIVISLPAENIQKTRGRITSSEGCCLREIDGIPVLKYLENIGIIIQKEVPVTIPLMVYYEGSAEPVALAIYAVNDDRSLMCAGEMPVGATVAIGEITVEGTLASTEECMERIKKTGKRDGALFLSCITRYILLTPIHDREMSLVADKMEKGRLMPFSMAYSHGEICPVKDRIGVLQNRFHNFSFIACVF
jgi:hypothetical protein